MREKIKYVLFLCIKGRAAQHKHKKTMKAKDNFYQYLCIHQHFVEESQVRI
jgi:hypothetical protein